MTIPVDSTIGLLFGPRRRPGRAISIKEARCGECRAFEGLRQSLSKAVRELEPLSELPLSLSRDDVARAFEPFVGRRVKVKDPEWAAHMKRRKKKIVIKGARRLITRWLPSGQRRETEIVEEYDQVWGGDTYARYDLDRKPDRLSPWEWQGELMLAATVGATRFRQVMLAAVIEAVRPGRILEIGCGNGINLFLAAGRFPEVEFHGLELTSVGYEAARRLQNDHETLPRSLQKFAPQPPADPTAHRRIHFHRGSAAELPFEAGEFDLVYTVLALEQMERIRQQALAEMARVTAGHAFNIEPFRDVNAKGWPRWNVFRRDYFRGAIDELEGFGLQPVWATDDYPQESFLKTAAVLSRKV